MTKEQMNLRLSHLASLIRQGKATPEQIEEYDSLDITYQKLIPPTPVAKNIWDLPIFGVMWEQDAREIER